MVEKLLGRLGDVVEPHLPLRDGEVRAADAEIRVVEAVHHRVGLEIAIADPTVPIPALGQGLIAQLELEIVAFVAADIITQPFDYTIDVEGVALTGLVILGYYLFLLYMSGKEYKQVIAEKFD